MSLQSPEIVADLSLALSHRILSLDEEGERRLHQLLHALPIAIYTTDPRGRITFYNEAAATLWGARPVIGSDSWCGSWRMYWPDGTPLPHDECPMAMAIKENRAINGMEAIAERPDGTQVPFLAFPSPLTDSTGAPLGAVNILLDITERKRSEILAQHLSSIVEFSDDAILSKDLNGTITSWNKGAERLFGYQADEIVGKPVTTLIPPERQSEEPDILARIRRGDRVDHFETVRQRKDGSRLDISLTISPVKDGRGRIVGASKIARDITAQKRAEAHIATLAREAEHRAKNVLATVQATVHLTKADTPEDLKRAIEGRIQALANVHSLFVQSRWTGAELNRLIRQELSPYTQDGEERTRLEGPILWLEPDTAQTIAVSIHELATNAAKYGALSVPQGCVRVEWSRMADQRLLLRWTETDGPSVTPPTRQGFGTRVLNSMIQGQLKGEVRFDWRPQGLACEIIIPT